MAMDISKFYEWMRSHFPTRPSWEIKDWVETSYGNERDIVFTMLLTEGDRLETLVYKSVENQLLHSKSVVQDGKELGPKDLVHSLLSAIHTYYGRSNRKFYYSMIGAWHMLNAVGASNEVLSEWKSAMIGAWEVLMKLNDTPSNTVFPHLRLHRDLLGSLVKIIGSTLLDNMSSYEKDLKNWETLLKRCCPTALR